MLRIIGILCFLPLLPSVCSQEQEEHRNFQYNSAIDPLTGRYNFAYDTGNDNDIAHSLHMQYQDVDGIVRGRYGYTDPRGKLRMVEYEAGPNGFIARGDVGPDMAPHDNKPAVIPERPVSSYQEGDFLLDPAPVQMAGWDPEGNPINQGIADSQGVETATRQPELENSEVAYISPFDRSLFPSVNATRDNEVSVYGSNSNGYDNRYPRVTYSTGETSNGIESESESYSQQGGTEAESNQGSSNSDVTSIDVDPDEIRAATGGSPVRRSADGTTSERMQEQRVSSQPVKVTTSDGRRLFYRDSHSTEPHEHYYNRATHDHDSEGRYYYDNNGRRYYYDNNRRTYYYDNGRRYYYDTGRTYYNDNSGRTYYYDNSGRAYYYDNSGRAYYYDNGRRYYYPRQTHDHDAERRPTTSTHHHPVERRTYYRPRQTHDHDAEMRYYRTGQNHDHGDLNIYQRVYRNGQTLYRDRHTNELHAHSSDAYRNHADHQHSDVQLYARYRNSEYPATARPRQLQYIPSDKYHDKQYYSTYS